eukprot:scaffold14478_cov15-Tisochrysis_lutea.AAC.2
MRNTCGDRARVQGCQNRGPRCVTYTRNSNPRPRLRTHHVPTHKQEKHVEPGADIVSVQQGAARMQ